MKTTQRIAKAFLAAVMVLSLSPFASLPAYAVEGAGGNADDADSAANANDAASTGGDAIPEIAGSVLNASGLALTAGTNGAAVANSAAGDVSEDRQPLFGLTSSGNGGALRAEGDVAPAGSLSNDWVWELVEGSVEGTYTLTFEYTGEADPAPALAIPASFTANNIGSYADKVTALELPECITQIGNNAFQNLTALESVTFPSTITSIGDNAFTGCSSLATADFSAIGQSVTYPTSETGTAAPNPNFTIGVQAFASTGLTSVTLPDNLNSIGNNAFEGCSKLKSASLPALCYLRGTKGTGIFANNIALEDVAFRTVDNRVAYKNDASSYLPENTMQNCPKLKKVDFSGYSALPDSIYFAMNQADKPIFRDSDLANLEELIFPEHEVRIIGGSSAQTEAAFANKPNFTDLSVLKNTEYVERINAYAFTGSGVMDADLSGWTALTRINNSAFANCPVLEHVVIPENVTALGAAAFRNCDQLKDVTIRAKNLTDFASREAFAGDAQIDTVVIGKEVDSISGNIFVVMPENTDFVFEGPNEFSVSKATLSGGSSPLKSLDGNYYADENGVLYKLDDDGTASVVYFPPDKSACTVPKTFTTPSGGEYIVDRVMPYAANHAHELQSITFEQPDQVYLSTGAFTGWTTADDNRGKLINGQPSITSAEWSFVSVLCDFPIENNTARLVTEITNEMPGEGGGALSTTIAINAKDPSADGTYDYKTGKAATYVIAIANDDNSADEKLVRVYLAYDGHNYHMGSFPVGDHVLSDQGKEYPLKVVETNTPGIYYYEISGVEPGDTLAFMNDTFFESPGSAGGSLRIWTHSISPAVAEQMAGRVINPTEYIKLDWDTTPIEFGISKANSKVYNQSMNDYLPAQLQGNSAGEIVVNNLAYTIKESNKTGSSALTEGQDFIRWVQYEDIVSLPEELYWREGVLDAIANGRWKLSNANINIHNSTGQYSAKALTVTVGGVSYALAYLYNVDGSRDELRDFAPSIVTENGEKKLRLTWYVNNATLDSSTGSASTAYSTQSFYLRFADNVLLADQDKISSLAAGEKPRVSNHVEETRHYSYSPTQWAESNVTTDVKADAGLAVRKYWNSYPNDTSRHTKYGGTDDFNTVEFKNTGVMVIDQWGAPVYATDEAGNVITGADGTPIIKTDPETGRQVWSGQILRDPIPSYFYITPQNIEGMFRASATVGGTSVDLGSWLTLTISKATLCTEGQYQPTEGTDQDRKYTAGADSNISASNDQGARVKEAATFTLKRGDDGRIQMTLAGDTKAENNRTYVIGEGGDYASLNAAFTAIGFEITRNTAYTAVWNTPDFSLRAGQTLSIPIPTTLKTTPMMLTQDNQYGYVNSYEYDIKNTAYYGALVGDESRTNRSLTERGSLRWQRELLVYKYGYFEGNSTQITSSDGTIELVEGTVVDYQVQGSNSSGRAYDKMYMSDYMSGAQVALVPKDKNPGLTAPDGSTLKEFVSNGIAYWILSVPGTYENVVIGAVGSRSGSAQNQVADIVVSETRSAGGTKRTSLNTQINWRPFTNWGGSSSSTSMYYKALVSGYEAGLTNEGEADESKTYKIDNKAWLGDHQGHRIWDTVGKEYQVYGFNKWILDKDAGGEDDGTASKDNGTLIKYQRLRPGDSVTYQIDINCLTTATASLSGSRIYDTLPDTKGIFAWTKGDIDAGIGANVTNLRYVASDGVQITVGSGEDAVHLNTDGTVTEGVDDYWSIVQTSAGNYRINWSNDFKITFPDHGWVKVYVDLQFPERADEGDSIWDRYLAALKGGSIFNTFYLDGRSSYVEHTLETEGKAVLYKGVYDTGITTHSPNDTASYGSYTTNKSRLMYSNGITPGSYSDDDLRASTVTYYTVLYNGSYDRLYLSDLQDQLPRGFTFNSMTNYIETSGNYYLPSSWASSGRVGYIAPGYATYTYTEYATSTESNKLVTIDNSRDALDGNTVKYVSAKVAATTSNGSDGRQHIKFTVSDPGTYTRSGYPAVHYDSVVKKYYLNPGEALRFGYNVLVGEVANTDDAATNTVAMPYYDYYGTGFTLDVPVDGQGGAVQKSRTVSGVTANDGKCQQMEAGKVASEYGIDTSAYSGEAYNNVEGGNWMVSSVTVTRGNIIPGIQKAVVGSTVCKTNPTATTIEGSLGSDANLYGTAYEGGLKSSDVVNWRVRVRNEAGAGNSNVTGTMVNYTLTDKVASPYSFTGQVFYNMYKATTAAGIRASKSSQYLFTIGTRVDGDTQARFASGNSLSNSGWRMVNIGSAENDSDDDWFTFGSGKKAGRVKLERNADGEEVITIQLTGTNHSIQGGMWADFCYHTMYVKDEKVVSDAKYNEAVIRPQQDYDASRVAQGRARTIEVEDSSGNIIERNDGVQSGASVTLTQGYTTESWKKVTQNTDTSNYARSDETTTYITLPEKCETFKYDLYVVGPAAEMSKFVLIDNLPHIGDHSAFVDDDRRFSDFKVGFDADNLDFKVYIANSKGGTETLLAPSRYTVSVNTKEEFEKADWEGAQTATHNVLDENGNPITDGAGENATEEVNLGWVDITPDMSAEDKAALLENARSFRVIIEDENAWTNNASSYLMKQKCQIHMSFNAKVDDPNAQPGKIAWNSFGYRYSVPLSKTTRKVVSLDAQPLNVGVRFPAAPSVEKQLVAETPVMEQVYEDVEVPVMVQQIDGEGNPVYDDDGNPVMVEQTEPVLDDEGNPTYDEDGNPVMRVVTTTESRPVMETVEEPVIDPETGKQEIDENGNPKTKQVEKPKMQQKMQQAVDEEGNPVVDENGDPVMEPVIEKGAHSAAVDLDFALIVYEGDAIEELDDALNMTNAQVAGVLQTNNRKFLYVPLTIEAGKSSASEGLWGRDFADVYDAESDSFTTGATPWHWRNGGRYTVVELSFGDYDYGHISMKANGSVHEANNISFDSYSSTVMSLVATNEWTPEYVDVSVAKTWDDDGDRDGVRARDITVHLLADGEEVDSAVLSEANDWAWTFEHVLAQRETGEHIAYTVTEDDVEQYTTVIEAAADDEYSISVTNTHKPETTSVPVSKIWEDADDQDGLRPSSIVVHLLADGKDTKQTLTLTEDGAWKGEFKDLPKYRDQGVEIAYTVTEDKIDGYTMAGTSGDAASGYVIENVHEPETVSFNGSKTWVDNDNKDGARPESITVNLLADGKVIDTRTVTAEDDWAWSFADLPKYRAGGVEIQYALTEDAVDNYTTTVDGFDVTNTFTAGETSVLVVKFWDDANNKDGLRTASVEVKLLADGVETGETLELTEDMRWTGTFTDLPKYRSDGTEIEYSVTEDQVPGYDAPEITGSVKHGFVVRNPHVPKKPAVFIATGDTLPVAVLITAVLTSAAFAFVASRRRRHEG